MAVQKVKVPGSGHGVEPWATVMGRVRVERLPPSAKTGQVRAGGGPPCHLHLAPHPRGNPPAAAGSSCFRSLPPSHLPLTQPACWSVWLGVPESGRGSGDDLGPQSLRGTVPPGSTSLSIFKNQPPLAIPARDTQPNLRLQKTRTACLSV